MGDPATFAVHRCRFVDFTPSAITTITFPPLPLLLLSAKGKNLEVGNQPLRFGTLAVGRANGNIELCEWTGGDRQTQAPQAWVVRKVSLLFFQF
jgi:U3 small nucleolar RNA-associated protein 4